MSKRVEPSFKINLDAQDPGVYGTSAPRLLGTSELSAPEPPKFSPISEMNLAAMEKQLETLKEQFRKLSNQKADKKDEMEDTVNLKAMQGVQFEMEAPFVILPILSPVLHPLYASSDKPIAIAVGTSEWLQMYDQLRAAGWPYYGDQDAEGIEIFLLKSAWIVWRELNYCVLSKYDESSRQWTDMIKDLESYVFAAAKYKEELRDQKAYEFFLNDILSRKIKVYRNNIEKFCMAYPEAKRQHDRLQTGYSKLIREIRENLGLYAFLPQNYETMKEGDKAICPPKDTEFFIGNVHVKNFLRHWTKYDQTRPVYVKSGNGVKAVYECSPPDDLQYAWIPIEVRQKIEEMKNLVQFRYMNPKDFLTYQVTLLRHQDLNENIRTRDESGRNFISVQDASKKGYRLFLASVNLDYENKFMREERGIPTGEKTLREWLAEYSHELTIYPLIHILLNVPASDGTPEKPKIYLNSGYVYDNISYKGRRLKLFYADAPIRAFKSAMVANYLGKPNPGESYSECLNRFINNVYTHILDKNVIPNLPELPPPKYRELLTQLFEYGGQPEILTSATVLTGPSSSAPKMGPVAPVSFGDLKGKSEAEKRAYTQDLLNMMKALNVA